MQTTTKVNKYPDDIDRHSRAMRATKRNADTIFYSMPHEAQERVIESEQKIEEAAAIKRAAELDQKAIFSTIFSAI